MFDFQQRHFAEVYPSWVKHFFTDLLFRKQTLTIPLFSHDRFQKLETGQYPSFKQIKEMKEDDFDFLEFEMANIIEDMYGYQTIE